MTAPRPLLDALDEAIAASQETTKQLVRTRALAAHLVDEADIDEMFDLLSPDQPVRGER